MQEKTIELIPFDKLLLDLENKRYNKIAGPFKTEEEVIDYMIEFEKLPFLVRSMLNSGYENDESLWVVPSGDNYVVREGNRRLSALRVLSNPDKYKAKIKGLSEYKPESILCSVYYDEDKLNNRIVERHTQKSIESWNRLAQAFQIQEEYDRYKNWDMVSGGSQKKELYKIANFYEKAYKVTSDIKSTFIHDEEGLSKLEVWRRLLGHGLPEMHFGFEVDENFKVKILDNSLFDKFVLRTTSLLLDNKIKSADIVSGNLDSILNKYFSDFLPKDEKEDTTQKEKEAKSDDNGGVKGTDSGDSGKGGTEDKPKGKRRKSRSTGARICLVSSSYEPKIPERYKREINILEELKILKVDSTPNAVSVLFRLFIEFSIDAYGRYNIKNYEQEYLTKPKDLPLRARFQAVVTECCKSRSVSVPKHVSRFWSDPNSIMHASTFNDYVHSPNGHPVPSDLRFSWDNLSNIFECIWEDIK